jgi:hypothetical protein
MITCRYASRLLSDRLDHRLSWFERVCLGVHLLGCRPCRRFRQAARWLHQTLGSPSPERSRDVRLPAEARERIRRALEQAGGNGTAN